MRAEQLPTLIRYTCLFTLLACSPLAEAETDRWYQVEIVVFANTSATKTDEIWPLTPLQYPKDMVSIAPETDDGLTPLSLLQVQQLEAYQSLFDENAVVNTASDSDFLFESRSRFPAHANMPTTEVSDLLGGDEDGDEGTNGTTDAGSGTSIETPLDLSALFESSEVVPFKNLSSNQRMLNDLARSIRRSSLYRLLSHQSWLQPISSDATQILLQAGNHYDSVFELDGVIGLSRSRYLHVDTDLRYTEFSPLFQGSGAAANLLSPDQRNQYPAVAKWEANRGQYIPVHAHPLQQSRRMRSSTLHFIDHPRFGVLIKIENYDPEETAD